MHSELLQEFQAIVHEAYLLICKCFIDVDNPTVRNLLFDVWGRSKSLAKTNRGKSQPFTLAVLLTFLARQHSLGAVGLAGRTQKTADSDEKLKLS